MLSVVSLALFVLSTSMVHGMPSSPSFSLAPEAGPLALPSIEKLVVFGDSWSDNGNVHSLSGGSFPPVPPYTGAFSNGDIYTKAVSQTWSKSTKVGASFDFMTGAYGGASPDDTLFAGKSGANSDLAVPDLISQISNYISKAGPMTQDRATTEFYVIWIGSDVYLNQSLSVDQVVGSTTASIQKLLDYGARNFVFPNMPSLDLVPAGSANKDALKAISSSHNSALLKSLTTLDSANSDMWMTLVDVADLVSSWTSSSTFKETSKACLSDSKNVCDSPDSYVWFDNSHFSAAAHALIGEEVIKAVASEWSACSSA